MFFTVNFYEDQQEVEVKQSVVSKKGEKDFMKILEFLEVSESPFSEIYSESLEYFNNKNQSN